MKDAAQQYLAADLCVLPARRDQKRPTVSWKPFQKRLPTTSELDAWFANSPDALCILCGAVSGGLELLDFDQRGALFDAWCEKVRAAAPGLLERLVIARTQNNGRHAVYCVECDVCGNMKLAQRPGDDGRPVTLIETRGEGGLFLCAPTDGYEVIQGDLCHPPVLTPDERDILLQAAWDLNEYLPPLVDGPKPASDVGQTAPLSVEHGHLSAEKSHNGDCSPENAIVGQRTSLSVGQGHSLPDNADRPGDDFNRRGDVRAVLEQFGWSCVKGGDNEYWRRPGKPSGWSATLRDRVFYVFSSNAAPFEPDRAYSPFAVYTMLAAGGDFEQAARSLGHLGFGGHSLADSAAGADISAIVRMSAAPGTCPSDNGHGGADDADSSVCRPDIADPGPMPAEMLRVPGFVSEVMDHCLAVAPYPNPVMAFGGALSLQAFLAGRRVRDSGDNRTNLYLLGLAHSGAGKDQSRKVNSDIIHAVGLSDCLGQHFASGEGIQDALFLTPCMLFQTDEIDGMLQSINKARDARHEAIMSTMLTMYSSANSVFPMRRKAGKESPGVIDQPCLGLYGTAIPNHYYEALSERMLTNGFFARMIILEAGPRSPGQEPSIRELPPRVLATARWWADYRPGTGNLEDWHPVPTIIEHTDQAKELLIETRLEAEAEYGKAEAASDAVGTTVWGRVSEQIRKLSLIYAVSEDHLSPRIGLAAVEWASRFVMHQTRRMLFMAAAHVADGEFDALLKRTVEILRQWRDKHGAEALMPAWELRRRLKQRPGDFKDIVLELDARQIAVFDTEKKTTKPKSGYRLL
ncbi:MAG: bifunctional DNA primase/polymerase [Planctomycetes bacterium]|nr:bifunctional DNA primase/polymerase [Planctomycetota bacterium]